MEWVTGAEPTGNALADVHATAFSSVASLYDGQDPSRLDTYRARADLAASSMSLQHRTALVAALRPYLAEVGASDASFQALDSLLHPQSVAVVTGQQAGLFTGPLYSVYKALTAIGLAERLERELRRPVVPVFWVASEDHDWAEVNHAYVLDAQHVVQRVRLNGDPPLHQMVYHWPLSEANVNAAVRDLYALLPADEAREDMVSSLRNAWHAGDSLATWFARILSNLVGDRGLVMLDPCLPALRDLARPVWTTALQAANGVSAALDAAYAAVEASGFQPAVIRDTANTTLFYVEDGKRYVLERAGEHVLRARGLGREASVEEWLALANERPTSFSSNVLLRPVVQDTLLPTVAYVGGAAEISYHALARAVFHVHGRTLPPLVMRQRMTIYPPQVRRHMSTWQLTPAVLRQPTDLIQRFLHGEGLDAMEQSLTDLGAATEQLWAAWAAQFDYLGPQVATMVRAQVDREATWISRMEHKGKQLVLQRHEAQVRQLQQIERWLWTDGHLQERRLSPPTLWSRFGAALFRQLPAWSAFEQPGASYDVIL